MLPLHHSTAYRAETICVGIARLGSEDQKVVTGSMRELQDVDFGAPLHCLVIVGETHPVEEEMLNFYALKTGTMKSKGEVTDSVCV